MKKGKNFRDNYKFTDSLRINDATYIDYLERFKRIALSMFEWVNLPKSMNARWLERCLYYNGQVALLKDKKYGFINRQLTETSQSTKAFSPTIVIPSQICTLVMLTQPLKALTPMAVVPSSKITVVISEASLYQGVPPAA